MSAVLDHESIVHTSDLEPNNFYDVQSYYESTDPEAVKEILALHAHNYVDHAILDASAIDGDAVTDRIDHSRGTNVEYVAASDVETGVIQASLRKIHVASLEDLPSLERCADGIDPELYARMLASHADGSARIVEIAALCKTKEANPESVLETYRKACQDSYRAGDTWFMGVVPKTLHKLREAFSDRIVNVVGEPQFLHIDGVRSDISLTPVLLEPVRVIDNFLANYYQAHEDGDLIAKYQALNNLVFFADGMGREELSDDVRFALDALIQGKDPATL